MSSRQLRSSVRALESVSKKVAKNKQNQKEKQSVKGETDNEKETCKLSTPAANQHNGSKANLQRLKRKHVNIAFSDLELMGEEAPGKNKLQKLKINELQQNNPKEKTENEDSTCSPPNWEEMLENIRIMRRARDAPVDSMGAEKCSSPESSSEVHRLHVLVSLMLSSQTKDNVTYAAMERLKKQGLTVDALINTDLSELQNLIYPVGFYKRKAEYLKKMAEILRSQYNDDIPSNVEDLCKLPGVGPKMAYLCMDIAWNKVVGIGVDTHVHRISNRLLWTKKPTKTPEATRHALESWLPKEIWREVNLLFVGFGQQICLPVNPSCRKCLNKSLCPSSRYKEITSEF